MDLLEKANEAVEIVVERGVHHSGTIHKDRTPEGCLKHAAEELIELAFAKDNDVDAAEELADVLISLLHFAQKRNITPRQIVDQVFHKLLTRNILSQEDFAKLTDMRKELEGVA